MLLFNYLDTLPKLYHFCSNRRDVYVSELRKFERICLKVTKLRLNSGNGQGFHAIPDFTLLHSYSRYYCNIYTYPKCMNFP